VLEPQRQRRELAIRLGADRALAPDALDAAEVARLRPDAALECSGGSSAIDSCLHATRPAGTIVLVGIPGAPLPVRSADIIMKELTVTGSIIYTDEFVAAIRCLGTREVDVSTLTSAILPLTDYEQAFSAGGHGLKYLVQP
jgi:threonine dehydrogenase-like Zn-dependent dehydrogenase